MVERDDQQRRRDIDSSTRFNGLADDAGCYLDKRPDALYHGQIVWFRCAPNHLRVGGGDELSHKRAGASTGVKQARRPPEW